MESSDIEWVVFKLDQRGFVDWNHALLTRELNHQPSDRQVRFFDMLWHFRMRVVVQLLMGNKWELFGITLLYKMKSMKKFGRPSVATFYFNLLQETTVSWNAGSQSHHRVSIVKWSSMFWMMQGSMPMFSETSMTNGYKWRFPDVGIPSCIILFHRMFRHFPRKKPSNHGGTPLWKPQVRIFEIATIDVPNSHWLTNRGVCTNPFNNR